MLRRTQYRRCGRRVALLALTLPLVATGPCLITAQQALINGFFDAVTPLLIERVADDLGVTVPTETVPDGGENTGFPTAQI